MANSFYTKVVIHDKETGETQTRLETSGNKESISQSIKALLSDWNIVFDIHLYPPYED